MIATEEFASQFCFKRSWCFRFLSFLDFLNRRVPQFWNNVETFHTGSQGKGGSDEGDGERRILGQMQPCPNLSELGLSFSQTSCETVDLHRISILFPSLKFLDLGNPGENYSGSLQKLSGLDRFRLASVNCHNDDLIPYGSWDTLNWISFDNCFTRPAESKHKFPDLDKFSNLKTIVFRPLVSGAETLFDSTSYSLEELSVLIRIESPDYAREIFGGKALKNLKRLEIEVRQAHGSPFSGKRALDSILGQILTLSYLDKLAIVTNIRFPNPSTKDAWVRAFQPRTWKLEWNGKRCE